MEEKLDERSFLLRRITRLRAAIERHHISTHPIKALRDLDLWRHIDDVHDESDHTLPEPTPNLHDARLSLCELRSEAADLIAAIQAHCRNNAKNDADETLYRATNYRATAAA